MKNRFAILVFLALFAGGSAQVGTSVSASYGPISASCSISYNATAGTVTFSSSSSGTSAGNAATVYYQTASAEGVYSSTLGSNGGGAGGHSGTYSASPGQWFRMWIYFAGPAEPAGWNAYEMYFQAVPPSNKVRISLPINQSDRDKTYKLIQGGVEVGTVVLEPGEGLIQTFTVPAGTDVTVVELVEDLVQDGPVWVEASGTVTQVPVGTVTPTSVPTGGGDPATTTVTPGDVQPQNTSTSSTEKQVWTPTSTVTAGTSDFTVKAYREGVDKIVAAINGDTTATNPDITTPAALWNPDTSVTTNALGKLPAPPAITAPTPVSVISVTLSLPKIGGTLTSKVITVDFSASPYATPIAVFRAICLACMAGWFFYISFNAIRSAFAGK